MLPKKRKVEKSLFTGVLNKSKSFYGKNISLRVFPIESLETTKFSFVVSKKVSNKANKRNLLKRRGFSVVKNIIKHTNKGFVCVFYYKKNALSSSYVEIEKDIKYLLTKARILKI